MNARDLRQALDDSLELVLHQGLRTEQAAKRFPELESDLLPLLRTMAAARQAPAMRMPDPSKNRVWESVEDKITATAPPAGRFRVRAGRFLRHFNYPQLAASFTMVSFLVASSWALASALTPAPVSSPIQPDTRGGSVAAGAAGGVTAPGQLPTESYASGTGGGISVNPSSGTAGSSGSLSTGAGSTVASANTGDEDSSGGSGGDSGSSGSSGGGSSSTKKHKPKPPQGNHGTGDEGDGPGLPVSTPTSLAVYAGDLENDLSWAAPADASGRLKGYDVYRSDTEDGTYQKVNDAPVASSGYEDPISEDELGLYYYKVRSVSKWGQESGLTEAEPNLYVKISHRFAAAGSDEVIAANGKLSFLVPTASLTQDTTVTIDERDTAPIVEDARQASPPYDFGPDGLSFSDSAPAHLSMGYYFGVSDAELDLLLSTTVNLYYFDEASGSAVQVPDGDVAVDGASKTVNAAVRHFTTYWSSAKVNPHGNSSSGSTDWCTSICHGLHGGGYSATKWNAYDVCVQCHGNTNSYNPPAGAGLTTTAYNIEAGFIDCADQTYSDSTMSRHPAPESLMVCSACHSPHRKITDLTDNLYYRYRDPITPGNYASAYTYSYTASPLGNAFCWGCHGTQANVWSVAVGQIASISYYTQSLGDHRTGYESLAAHDVSLPASGAAPNAWVPPTSALGDRQGVNQSTNIRCENCHYHHGTSQARALTGYRLTSSYQGGREENLCYQCHTQTWKAGMKNIRGEFSKAYSHTVGSQTYYHNAYSESLTGVIAGQRHVECVDCHNTHRARMGTHTRGTNAVTGALVGAMGVVPNFGSTTGTAGSYAITQSATREYQICLRCHSSFDASAPKEISIDFNINNPSYHPVTSVGRNSTMAAGTLTAPWTASSTMYCSDCHTSDSTSISGPHGSTNAYMLARAYSTASRTSSTGFLCYICHQYNTYYAGTNTQSYFKKSGNDNLHYTHVNAAKAPQMNCWRCHDSHGSGFKQRLIAEGRGINAFIGPAPSNYSTSNCTTTGCHGSDDNCYTCHGETGGNQRVVYLMGRGFAGSVNGGVAKTYHHNMTSPTTAFAGTSADPPTTSVSTNTCEGRCHAKHAEHTGTNAKSLRAGNVERELCLYCHGVAGRAYPARTFTSVSYSGTAHDYSTLGYTENRWNPSVGYSANYQYTKNCNKCHAPHGTNIKYLVNEVVENMGNTGYANYTTTAVSGEAQRDRACFACHGPKGPAPRDVSTAFNESSRHDVFSTGQAGRHQATSTEATGSANRHVLCEDCHNPHGATASNVLSGVWGVTVSYGPLTYTRIAQVQTGKGWQLCFKCHSGYVTLPAGRPNVAVQFTPTVAFQHGVMSAGVMNPNALIDATFVSPWTRNSRTTCTDCHGDSDSTAPKGVHASAAASILRTPTSSAAPSGASDQYVNCFLCHRWEVYDNNVANTSGSPSENNSRFDHSGSNGGHDKLVGDTTVSGIWCLACHGGKEKGGIHGTTNNTLQHLNGQSIASYASFTAGTITCDTVGSGSACTQHTGGKSYTANF